MSTAVDSWWFGPRPEGYPVLTAEERRSLPAAAKALPEAQARALFEEQQQHATARCTSEAQADIAAVRAAPTRLEVAMQEVDRAAEHALHEFRNTPTAYSSHEETAPAEVGLDAALSNAALADTSAVREMGGADAGATPVQAMYGKLRRELAYALGVDRDTDWETLLARASLPIRGEAPPIPPDAIVLTGPEAERYRALQAAARKAQASAATARADGAALLQLFQAFCAGLDPASEKT